MPDEIMGTTFLDNGRWVLRHEGGAGNKVPLTGPPELLAQLEDGGAKVFLETYARDHPGRRRGGECDRYQNVLIDYG